MASPTSAVGADVLLRQHDQLIEGEGLYAGLARRQIAWWA